MQIWIIGRDSYPRSPLQASFSPRSGHIVEIGSHSKSLLRRFDIHERFHPPPQRFGDKIVQMWIIGQDSYPRSPLQASFSPRSGNIVKIGSGSIVSIVM